MADVDDWKHLSATSELSRQSMTDGHTFVPVKSSGGSCNICSGVVATDGFFMGLECAGCRTVVHEACRGMFRKTACRSPRAGASARVLLVGDGAGGGADDAAAPAGPIVSSPKNASKIRHVSFRAATGEFHGLDASESVALFFGAPLTGQPRMALVGYADRIPVMLVLLAQEMIRRGGLEAEGIFRLSAESSSIVAAKEGLNAGAGVHSLAKETSPHLFAALIKDLFRSLPPGASLMGAMSATSLAEVAKTPSGAAGEATWKSLLETDAFLREPNRSIFTWTIDLMALVAAQEPKNKMNARALSIVFAPSLWEAPSDMPPLNAMNAIKDVAGVLHGALSFVIAAKPARKPLPLLGV